MTVEPLHTPARPSQSLRRRQLAPPTCYGAAAKARRTGVDTKLIVRSVVALLLSTGAAAAATNPPWVHVNAPRKQVTFDISEGPNGQAGQYNFDGYAHGHMTVTVPTGWHVTIKVTNNGSTGHSMEIIKAPKTPPVQEVQPAFKHAETIDLHQGMPPGASSQFSFTAGKPGQYWIMCGVPGHALLGMWDHFVVSSSAKRPSVTEHS